MPKWLYTVLVFARLNTKRFFRDRLALFFGIAFPLIFLFVLGSIFGRDRDVSFRVALLNQSASEVASQFAAEAQNDKVFKIDQQTTSLANAEEKMIRGQLDATIVLPPDFGEQKAGQGLPTGQAKIIYTQNNREAARTLGSVLESKFKAVNARFVSTDLPFSVANQQLNRQSLSPFDYTFSGLLGFAIVGLGIFGPVNVFPELKKQGVLRRLSTTPLKVWQYFISTAVSQTIVGLVTMVIMFLVALSVFGLNMAGNYLELAVFLTLSIIAILGIGLALGGWAKNERQVAPLDNIVVFPMLFLSGTFFPRFVMPEWLQNVSEFLPLTPVIEGLRLIATEGKHLTDIGPQLGLVAVWTVIIYAVAFRFFRWE